MTDTAETTKQTKRHRRMARDQQTSTAREVATEAPGNEPTVPASKASMVLDLLQRTEGATIAQLTDATDWQPHTTRAALTGLKKKGHTVTSTKTAGEDRVYRVSAT